MRLSRLFCCLVLLVGFCGFLLYSAHQEVKSRTIDQLNRLQYVLAKQAAGSIEGFFNHCGDSLRELSGNPHIISLDDRGKELLAIFQSTDADNIRAVTRTDTLGRVIHTFPPNPMLFSLHQHEHMQEIIRTHQPVISDVFDTRLGSKNVAFHVPVFDGDTYTGTLGILIAFDKLGKKYLEGIEIGEDGYAWMISAKGVELYCPVPGHVGRPVFENCGDFPDILAMAEQMVQKKQGATSYVFDKIRGETRESSKKYAVFVPIDLGVTFWSIVVATPESEMLQITAGFRHRWFPAAGILLITVALASFYIVRARVVMKEEARRKLAEEALIFVNRQLSDIIEFLPDATFVIDKDGQVIAWNRAIEEMTGVDKKEMIGKGNYECMVPFYGERRRHLLDLIDAEDKELESRYRYVKRKGNTLFCETFVPKVCKGRGAHVFATGAPLFDAHGNRAGSIESIRDITDFKRAEIELRESEARYRAFISNSSEAIWRIESEQPIPISLSEGEQVELFYKYGRLAECSDVLAHMYGLEKAEQLIGARLARMLSRIDPRNAELLKIFIRSGYRIVQHEFFLKRGDKERCFMSSITGTVENGCLVGAWGVQRDITDYKRTEEALRESQQQLADIIDFLPDATLVIDTNGRVIAWNKAIEEMTGAKASEMLGKGDYEYALPFYSERRPLLIDLVLTSRGDIETKYSNLERRGSVLAGETIISSLNGRRAYLFGTASVLRDSKGNIVGAIESVRDITERMRVEEALRQADRKYRNIFENAVMGIFQTSPEGPLISANLAFARILGYDSSEEVLSALTDMRQVYVNPVRRPELLCQIEERGTVRDFEVQYYRKDKTIAWVILNVRAVSERSGNYILEGTAEDVTARKSLEAQLRQSQKMEAIGTLAGGIAHDFNNMLAPIIGYSELLLQKMELNPQWHQSIQKILQSGCRARDLVKQILTFSRQTDQELRPVQMSIIVREVLNLLRSTLPSTIEIRRNFHPDAVETTVMANAIQIHQVLMNLCTNAAHAMRERGGVLEIGLRNVTIDCSAEKECSDIEHGSYLRLTVSDTGHGMDEAVKQRIFDPYYTTKGPDEGTGLGLAVVYGIVKSLSGGITVLSTPGKGTVFHIYFPVSQKTEKIPVDFAASLPKGEGYILVVDDEKYIAEMLRDMIEQLGYESAVKYSSAEALEIFKAQPERFDLVITDQTMPGMTGDALAQEILKVRPDIPIVLCTGFSEMIDETRAEEIGIEAFLMKPVALRQLAEEIHRILEDHDGSN